MPNRAGGLNKMKKVYNKKEEGVSPVIATILMVAITVVLAATVYIMVAGMGTGGTNKMIASLTYDQQQSNPNGGSVYLKVSMSNPSSAAPAKVKIVITPKSGSSFTLTYSSTNKDWENADNTTVKATLMDLDGSGTLSDGDELVITGLYSGDTVSIAIDGYSGNAQTTIP